MLFLKRLVAMGLLATALLIALHGVAIAGMGSISGTVRSTEGAPIAYANVILVGTNRGAISLGDGAFTINAVPPGTYIVKVLGMTFEPVVGRSFTVVNENQKLNFVVERIVLPSTRKIVITADQPMVEVTSSDARGTVSSEQLQEMPVNDVLEAIRL